MTLHKIFAKFTLEEHQDVQEGKRLSVDDVVSDLPFMDRYLRDLKRDIQLANDVSSLLLSRVRVLEDLFEEI